jgi:hypothetical protein
MTEIEVLTAVRQVAEELSQLGPGERVINSEAYRKLQSQPGKGGPLMQWFNRETEQSRKMIISEILGHFARTAYQQKPEFNQNAASELRRLCNLLHPLVADDQPPLSAPAPPAAGIVQPTVQPTTLSISATTQASDTASIEPQIASNYQQAIVLWNAGGRTWGAITEELGVTTTSWKAFSAAVKRFAAKTGQTLRAGNTSSSRELPNAKLKSN